VAEARAVEEILPVVVVDVTMVDHLELVVIVFVQVADIKLLINVVLNVQN